MRIRAACVWLVCLVIACICVLSLLAAGIILKFDERRDARQERRNERDAHIANLRSYVPRKLLTKVEPDFFDYPGVRDWYRFPLVYPYSVGAVDDLKYGYLDRADPSKKIRDGGAVTPIVHRITHLSFDKQVLVARVYSGDRFAKPKPSEIYWVVFQFATGRLERFKSKAAALRSAQERGFSGRHKLETVKTHYHRCFP